MVFVDHVEAWNAFLKADRNGTIPRWLNFIGRACLLKYVDQLNNIFFLDVSYEWMGLCFALC